MIEDEGRTQIPQGSVTCCALGPELGAKIDEVTSALKLY